MSIISRAANRIWTRLVGNDEKTGRSKVGKQGRRAGTEERRWLFVNNIPISYRNALFGEIQRAEPGARILYLASTETVRREVDVSHLEGVEYKILRSIYRGKAKGSATADVVVNFIPASQIIAAKVVVFFGYNYIANIVGALTAIVLGRKTVLFCETTLQEANTKAWRVRAKRLFVPVLFDRFIVSGIASKQFIESLGVPKSKIHIAINGAPELTGRKNLKVTPGDRKLRVGLLGRLAPEKNFEWAIKALVGGPSLEIHVGGDGPLYAQLAAIEGPIVMHGNLRRDQLAAYFDLVDILVVPSSIEAWGFVVNEAISCGCPVILSDRVGCRFEIAPDAGVVFPHGSEVELMASVAMLRDRLAEYSSAARERSRQITLRQQADSIVQYLRNEFG